jgi:hypothetical protein
MLELEKYNEMIIINLYEFITASLLTNLIYNVGSAPCFLQRFSHNQIRLKKRQGQRGLAFIFNT